MGAAAIHIDVDAVGFAGQEICHSAQTGEDFFRGGRGRAVGAVHQHAHTLQTLRHGRCHKAAIIGSRIAAAGQQAADLAKGFGLLGGRRINGGLDGGFLGVSELIAVAAEDFNAVMLVRIVRRGNHDAGVGLVIGDGGAGYRRGRQHAQAYHIAAGSAQAGGQRRLQHSAGNAGITTDEHAGLPLQISVQLAAQGKAGTVRQIGGQLNVGNAADTIGSKIFSHNCFLLLPNLRESVKKG